MKRKITDKLIDWKKRDTKMPFLLLGARQVGKTYILKEFCEQHYLNPIYINLEENNAVRQIFDEKINPEEVIRLISIEMGHRIVPENSIIFFDEIQVSERAVTSLKYCAESSNKYNIVCAGSLLGVALNRFKGAFPVGKVEINHLYPMDFEEFLWAANRNELNEEIKKHFRGIKQMPEIIHNRSMNIYKDYLFVGGMPAAVLEYLEKGRDIAWFNRDIKNNILQAYIYDMSKYTTNAENIRIHRLYDSIPKQLNKENSKFTYKLISEGANKRLYETSIEWLL
ncbi:MAG: AAA family ATPase, partial [Clostridia bacterium]|nr:AAA family ATPase [Clostridia bacterium]